MPKQSSARRLVPIARLLAVGVHQGPPQTAADEGGPNEGACSKTRTPSAREATPVLAHPPKGPARLPVQAFDLCCSISLRAQGHTLSLSLNNRQAVLQLLQRTITPPLDLGCHMQHMPDISLMAVQSLDLAECLLNSSSSITDTALTEESLLTQVPPDQGPTFSIHCDWRQGGPHLSAVNINHIEVGFSSLAAVLFIQGQGTWRARLLLAQPLLRTFSSFLHDPANASQTHTDATHFHQTCLDIAITRMRLNQQCQNLCLHLHRPFRWVLSDFQGCFQSLGSFLFPSIQRLTRNVMGTAQLAQQPMCWLGNQQLTDPLDLLFDCATMMHGSSLRTVGFFHFHHISQGCFLQCFSSIVTVVHAHFEPCLRDHREWRKKVCTSTTNVHKGGVQTQHSMIAMQPESLAMPDSLRLHGRMRRMSRLKSLRQHWSRGTFHR